MLKITTSSLLKITDTSFIGFKLINHPPFPKGQWVTPAKLASCSRNDSKLLAKLHKHVKNARPKPTQTLSG